MAVPEIVQFPCLSDNYGYLVHCPDTGATAAIDTPDVEPYMEVRNFFLGRAFKCRLLCGLRVRCFSIRLAAKNLG